MEEENEFLEKNGEFANNCFCKLSRGNSSALTNFMSNFLLSDHIHICSPYLSSEIIDNEYKNNLSHLLRQIPGALSDKAYFEVRLDERQKQVDISIPIYKEGLPILAGISKDKENLLPPSFFRKDSWMQLSVFCKACMDKESVLSKEVSSMFLEIDGLESIPQIPEPCIYFGLQQRDSKETDEKFASIICEALRLLRGQELPGKVHNQVLKSIQYFPKTAFLFQVGAMLTREPAIVRYCIRNIKPQELIDFLKSLDCDVDFQNLYQYTQTISQCISFENVSIALDICDQIGTKIGFECPLGGKANNQQIFCSFTDYLINRGLCTSEKRKAVWDFIGYSDEKTDFENWPSHLLIESEALGVNNLSVNLRNLSHIKLVFQFDQVIEAKAYLTSKITRFSPKKAAIMKLAYTSRG